MCLTWIATMGCKVTNVTRCNARYATFASVRRIHVMPSTFASFFSGPTKESIIKPKLFARMTPLSPGQALVNTLVNILVNTLVNTPKP